MLKVLVSFLPAQGMNDIGRHCAMNAYWIISHLTTSPDVNILYTVFDDELNILLPINVDLCSDDFEAIEMISWLLANAASPKINILKLIILNTKIVQIIEKLTYHLSNQNLSLSVKFMETIGFLGVSLTSLHEPPLLETSQRLGILRWCNYAIDKF